MGFAIDVIEKSGDAHKNKEGCIPLLSYPLMFKTS